MMRARDDQLNWVSETGEFTVIGCTGCVPPYPEKPGFVMVRFILKKQTGEVVVATLRYWPVTMIFLDAFPASFTIRGTLKTAGNITVLLSAQPVFTSSDVSNLSKERVNCLSPVGKDHLGADGKVSFFVAKTLESTWQDAVIQEGKFYDVALIGTQSRVTVMENFHKKYNKNYVGGPNVEFIGLNYRSTGSSLQSMTYFFAFATTSPFAIDVIKDIEGLRNMYIEAMSTPATRFSARNEAGFD